MKTKIYKKNNMYYKMVNGELIKLTPIERFIKFLRDEMVYQRYRYNRFKKYNFNKELTPCMEKLGKNLYIDGAFMWRVTEDGWNFWNDISEKWDEVLRIEGYDND